MRDIKKVYAKNFIILADELHAPQRYQVRSASESEYEFYLI